MLTTRLSLIGVLGASGLALTNCINETSFREETVQSKNATEARPHQHYEDAGGWTASQCYRDGQQWTAEDLEKGANDFCYWAQGRTVEPGNYLNYTWHYCVDGIDHRQWFSIQTQTGAKAQQIQYAQCMDGLLPFIENCNTKGKVVKQGGWGMNKGGYMIIDGDPELHNTGKAMRTWDCANIKTFVAAHRAMENESTTCADGGCGIVGSSVVAP